MSQEKYQDHLWEEIPGSAFIALGRRGREHIYLQQCFIPGCNENTPEKIHIIQSTSEDIPTKDPKAYKKQIRFLIHCDTCTKNFHLVFERYIDKQETPDKKEGQDQVIFENVFATDESGEENYGQIGFVQMA